LRQAIKRSRRTKLKKEPAPDLTIARDGVNATKYQLLDCFDKKLLTACGLKRDAWLDLNELKSLVQFLDGTLADNPRKVDPRQEAQTSETIVTGVTVKKIRECIKRIVETEAGDMRALSLDTIYEYMDKQVRNGHLRRLIRLEPTNVACVLGLIKVAEIRLGCSSLTWLEVELRYSMLHWMESVIQLETTFVNTPPIEPPKY